MGVAKALDLGTSGLPSTVPYILKTIEKSLVHSELHMLLVLKTETFPAP